MDIGSYLITSTSAGVLTLVFTKTCSSNSGNHKAVVGQGLGAGARAVMLIVESIQQYIWK